jgi:hypothetical protein
MATWQEAEEVLARWREVERLMEAAPTGSAEHEELVAEAAALRDEYQRIVDLAKAEPGSGGPEPAASASE